jgi:hypothetical protein
MISRGTKTIDKAITRQDEPYTRHVCQMVQSGIAWWEVWELNAGPLPANLSLKDSRVQTFSVPTSFSVTSAQYIQASAKSGTTSCNADIISAQNLKG